MPSNCLACTACCRGLVVYLAKEDFLRIGQEYIDYTHGQPHMRQRDDHVHTCVALDTSTGRCTIYENRPLRCRQFQENGERCKAWRIGKFDGD